MKTFEQFYDKSNVLYHKLNDLLVEDLNKTFESKYFNYKFLDSSVDYEIGFNLKYIEKIDYKQFDPYKNTFHYGKKEAQSKIKALDSVAEYFKKFGIEHPNIVISKNNFDGFHIQVILKIDQLYKGLESYMNDELKNELKSLIGINKFNL